MDTAEFQRALSQETRTAIEAWSQSRARSVYLGEQTALCQVLGRYKCFVDTTDIGITPHLMFDGYWEMWITSAIARFVKPGMRCIDVGANAGYYTLLLAELVGERGHVQAWEPQPRLADLIERSVETNGFANRVDVVHHAAGAAEERREFIVPKRRGLNATLRSCSSDAFDYGVNEYEVTVRRIDEGRIAPPIDFVKIDSEGWEPFVWEGMSGILQKSPSIAICMEFSPERYADAHGFLERMRADGFKVQLLDTDGWLQPVADTVLLARENMVWITKA